MTYRPLANEEYPTEYPKPKDEDTHSTTTPLTHFGSSLDDAEISSDLIQRTVPDKHQIALNTVMERTMKMNCLSLLLSVQPLLDTGLSELF